MTATPSKYEELAAATYRREQLQSYQAKLDKLQWRVEFYAEYVERSAGSTSTRAKNDRTNLRRWQKRLDSFVELMNSIGFVVVDGKVQRVES